MSEIISLLQDAATRMRIDSIRSTTAAGSGHPTSCASMAEIMAVLFLKEMRYKPTQPENPSNDRFVLSKGHAAPILYAAWVEAGLISENELGTLRKLTSDYEGHPTPRLPWVDVATGSLGQGLSCAAGIAYVAKYFDQSSSRVYCLIGDGESAEGSIWEAMAFASTYKLDNLVLIFDVNRLGQSQPTSIGHCVEVYKSRAESFGWHTVVIDGHDVKAISEALSSAHAVKDKPFALVCKTYKGYGFQGISDEENWHGKPLGDKSDEIIKQLESTLVGGGGDVCSTRGKLKPSEPTEDCKPLHLIGTVKMPGPPEYKIGQKVSTRLAYGNALLRLGKACNRVIGLDGDTKNSTFSIKLRDALPNQFIECFIAEQNLVGVAIGCAVRERTIPFASTFAAFFSRAFDQIRMGAISRTNCNFAGSHVGVSIGEDGPSQMALEDLAMFRSIIGSTVFYPTDAVATDRAVELAANTRGICYIRTGRPDGPVIYAPDEVFTIGKGKVVRTSGPTSDNICIVGAGVTLYEALKAADVLSTEGVNVRIIDPFTVKPIDVELLATAARETACILTVEDHVPEGGLGDAVSAAVSAAGVACVVHRIGITEVPRSGKPFELMAKYGIDAASIVATVKRVCKA